MPLTTGTQAERGPARCPPRALWALGLYSAVIKKLCGKQGRVGHERPAQEPGTLLFHLDLRASIFPVSRGLSPETGIGAGVGAHL